MLETGLAIGRSDSYDHLIVITTILAPVTRVCTNNSFLTPLGVSHSYRVVN